jgi:hypothetical protein
MFVTYAVRICRGLKINFDWRHGTLEYVHIRCAGVSCGANGHIYIYNLTFEFCYGDFGVDGQWHGLKRQILIQVTRSDHFFDFFHLVIR